MDPISFTPLYMKRIWGGRKLEEVYGRALPDSDSAFGEAWEIVDRENEQSLVANGKFSGTTLHELWKNHRLEIFGADLPDTHRFPLLIKILDSSSDLSIQVHPPAEIAEILDGEPKTEMWYIADAKPDAKLYVGLKKTADRESFTQAIMDGTVADQVHAITPQTGESIFIESGRLHAIGAGFLIHEIQQNSDTTFRVFDWNRTDSEGNPRELHVEESLACIDFDDHEPMMDEPDGNLLATCPYFTTTKHSLEPGEEIGNPDPERFSLVTVVSGCLADQFPTGQTVLLPKGNTQLIATDASEILQITIPQFK